MSPLYQQDMCYVPLLYQDMCVIVPVDAARPVGAPFPLSTRLFLPTTVPVSADRPDAGETSTLPHYSTTRRPGRESPPAVAL